MKFLVVNKINRYSNIINLCKAAKKTLIIGHAVYLTNSTFLFSPSGIDYLQTET